MKFVKFFAKVACCLTFDLISAGCGKMDSTYRHYIEGGEIIYVGKADSVQVSPGKNRIQLWLLVSDPKISKAVVYWDNKANSQAVEIVRRQQVDTVDVILDNVSEGYHTFEIYTFDNLGNSSIKVDVSAEVYGENYTGSLLNRTINRIEYINGDIIIHWQSAGQRAIGTQLNYTDVADKEHVIWIDSASAESILPSFKPNSSIRYHTAYIPMENAIDTFYAEQVERAITFHQVEDAELDQNLFSAYPLPGDASPQPTAGNVMSNLWNGIFAGAAASTGSWYRTANGSGVPHHFQIDLGVKTTLSHYKLWQRGTVSEHNLLYANGNLRKWEVWGALDPSSDGSYDGWVKLLDCEAVKPSALPMGQNAPEDIAYAAMGEQFIFPKDIPEIRYIRVKVLQTWANTDYMFAGEIRFWGSGWEVE